MIVKIQRPLNSSDQAPMAMIYNKDRSYQGMPPYTSVEHLFPNNEMKVYFHVEVTDTGLTIGEKAPDQNW